IDSYILFAVKNVSHRRSLELRVRLELPQKLARRHLNCREHPAIGAKEENAAREPERAAPGIGVASFRQFPDDFPVLYVDRAQDPTRSLIRYETLRAAGVTSTRTPLFRRPRGEYAALLECLNNVVTRGRVVGGGKPVRGAVLRWADPRAVGSGFCRERQQ